MLPTSLMRTFWIVFSVLAISAPVLLAQTTSSDSPIQPKSEAQLRQQNQLVTEHLFRQYIAVGYRIQTAEVDAAVELVATRGIDDANFVRSVLVEFDKSWDQDQPHSKRKTLAVLSRMLGICGIRRYNQGRNGESVFLPPPAHESEILKKVINRGRLATADVDEFVMCVIRSGHPDGKPFLQDVLSNSSGAEKFHAAVGLAALGDSTGVDWLLELADPTKQAGDESVNRGTHFYAEGDSLRENSLLVLSSLAGMGIDGAFNQLRDWWNENKDKFDPERVELEFGR